MRLKPRSSGRRERAARGGEGTMTNRINSRSTASQLRNIPNTFLSSLTRSSIFGRILLDTLPSTSEAAQPSHSRRPPTHPNRAPAFRENLSSSARSSSPLTVASQLTTARATLVRISLVEGQFRSSHRSTWPSYPCPLFSHVLILTLALVGPEIHHPRTA